MSLYEQENGATSSAKRCGTLRYNLNRKQELMLQEEVDHLALKSIAQIKVERLRRHYDNMESKESILM